MMNKDSNWWRGAVVAVAVVAGACGSDSDGAANKGDWEKDHG